MQNLAGYLAARVEVEKLIGKPLTVDFIKTLNALVVGIESSDYRNIGAGIWNRSRKLVYLAPFNERVPDLMENLLVWLNEDNYSQETLKRAAIFHWRFVKIHPFCIDRENNGNGRTARLLSTFILRSAGCNTIDCYALEDFFEKNKDEYYAALEGSLSWNPDEDMALWVQYFCSSLKNSSPFNT
jgi:Fic family protein